MVKINGKPKNKTGCRFALALQLLKTVDCGLYGLEENVGITKSRMAKCTKM
jgi:hypothetical protein